MSFIAAHPFISAMVASSVATSATTVMQAGKTPAISEIPPIQPVSSPYASTPQEIAKQEASIKEEEKEKLQKGVTATSTGKRRKATILTGPQGVLAPVNVARKYLLGE